MYPMRLLSAIYTHRYYKVSERVYEAFKDGLKLKNEYVSGIFAIDRYDYHLCCEKRQC